MKYDETDRNSFWERLRELHETAEIEALMKEWNEAEKTSRI